MAALPTSVDATQQLLSDGRYVADRSLSTVLYLSLNLGRPLFLEGEAGTGKTEIAKVLANTLDRSLVRLQCYEGLSAENTLYEWNYTKQLLAVQAGEGGVGDDGATVFDEEFLLERPLLRALTHDGPRPPVLLIDEVDRADEEFEALLLEVLSDFQVSIPELGTIGADEPPIVIITSNRTRGLSDALKRRCLFLHIEPPSMKKEQAIVREKVPELDGAVAAAVTGAVQRLREEPLLKQPGVAETLDWARAIADLRRDGEEALTTAEVRNTLGCLLKEVEDVERVDDELLSELLAASEQARAQG